MDGNEDIIGFLKRAVGYSMTGDITERSIFLLHGIGSNGKSTFINAISNILGDYGQSASFTSFISKKNTYIPNDIARMQGKRFISSLESEEGTQFSEALIKQLTGGDTITARFLNREFFDFKPQFKLWLAANHKPTIKGTDNAIWLRIKLIPFDVIIPEFEQDRYLGDKLEKELPGILNWAVAGCLEWQKEGLKVPEGVSFATQNYREEMDILGIYIKERCIVNPMVSASSHDLFNDYKMWCEESREKALTQNRFGRKMTERGFVIDRSTSKRFRKGIGLKEGGQGEVNF
jgi:putative DNA primase/helicase